jgi:DNA-binding NtrC family response regulator
MAPPDVRCPEILVVCRSEVILYGVTGLLMSVGYAVQGFADPWLARKRLTRQRFDLAIVGSTDQATDELLTHLARCAPPVPVLVLDGVTRARGSADGTTLLSAVASLVGNPEPPGGSPGPAAA